MHCPFWKSQSQMCVYCIQERLSKNAIFSRTQVIALSLRSLRLNVSTGITQSIDLASEPMFSIEEIEPCLSKDDHRLKPAFVRKFCAAEKFSGNVNYTHAISLNVSCQVCHERLPVRKSLPGFVDVRFEQWSPMAS